ncbi:MAG: CDP-alcohol phosphatidyltransferase family protein [Chloroflexi bacterium]|nr:MAG: CDP-alcohol phosphatidyltransferase family protein [Chloroflexota bacterium]
MLTEWGRRSFKPFLESIATVFRLLHLTPDTVTVLGVVLSLGVAYLVITNRIFYAGLLYILAGGADAVDGTLARQLGIRSKFGAFLDSTLDRIGESIVSVSLGYWAALNGNTLGVLLAFTALITSLLVSYTRARAEGLGLECKVGIGTRVERYIIMAACLLLNLPVYGLALITLLAGITVIQRIVAVWQQTRV